MSPDPAYALGIHTPTATVLATITDPHARRAAAAAAILTRKAELGLLAVLLYERDGTVVKVAKLERDDEALADLTVLAVA